MSDSETTKKDPDSDEQHLDDADPEDTTTESEQNPSLLQKLARIANGEYNGDPTDEDMRSAAKMYTALSAITGSEPTEAEVVSEARRSAGIRDLGREIMSKVASATATDVATAPSISVMMGNLLDTLAPGVGSSSSTTAISNGLEQVCTSMIGALGGTTVMSSAPNAKLSALVTAWRTRILAAAPEVRIYASCVSDWDLELADAKIVTLCDELKSILDADVDAMTEIQALGLVLRRMPDDIELILAILSPVGGTSYSHIYKEQLAHLIIKTYLAAELSSEKQQLRAMYDRFVVSKLIGPNLIDSEIEEIIDDLELSKLERKLLRRVKPPMRAQRDGKCTPS